MMNGKREPEIHKQFCHWVESPNVTYKKKCAFVRVCVKFPNKMDRFTYEWCWMKNNKSMILISISETGCYDKRSESNFCDSQYACVKSKRKKKLYTECIWKGVRSFKEKWMGNKGEKRDDDDGGNASTFKNKWQYMHIYISILTCNKHRINIINAAEHTLNDIICLHYLGLDK